jgi:hypothetical protein
MHALVKRYTATQRRAEHTRKPLSTEFVSIGSLRRRLLALGQLALASGFAFTNPFRTVQRNPGRRGFRSGYVLER